MKKLYSSILTFLGLGALIAAIAIIPNLVYALTPADTTSGYTWAGNNYHDFEWNIIPTVDPSPEAYFWGLDFYFNNGSTMHHAEFGLKAGTSKTVYYTIDGIGSASVGYNWTVGDTYYMYVELEGPGTTSGTAAWGAYIRNVTTGSGYQLVSDLDVPSAWTGLSKSNDSLVTQYLGGSLNCSDQTHAQAEFTNFTADARTSSPGLMDPSGGPNNSSNSTSCGASSVTDIGSRNVKQDMGVPVPPSGGTTNTGGNPPPPPPPGTNTASGNTNTISNTATAESLIVSVTSTAGSTTTTNSQTGSPFSGTVPFASTTGSSSGSASSLTGGSSKKKHKTSAFATVAEFTGIGLLILLIGWLCYLMFIRFVGRPTSSKNNVDSDLYFDHTINNTVPPPITHNLKSKSKDDDGPKKLTRDEYIEFGQEAVLLEELKSKDEAGPPSDNDPSKQS